LGYFTAVEGLLVGVYETRMGKQGLEGLLKSLDEVSASLKPSVCQFFNADRVASALHVAVAATVAMVAWRSKMNVAKKLEVEFLVRLSAQDQISRAIEILGISYETDRVGVCVMSKDAEGIELTRSKLERLFGCKLVPFVDNQSEYMVDELSKIYGVPERALKSVQAGNRFKALELLLMERVAISLISR